MKQIYFDNAATTTVDKKIIEKMLPFFSDYYGNASSLHNFAETPAKELMQARERIAKALNANPCEIIFTSCGTEANNLAIYGILKKTNKKHIITSSIEHPAVLNTCKALEKDGYKITYLNVDKDGVVDINQLKESITKDTALITIMAVNNEIGSVQPLEKIIKIAKENNVPVHSDAVQALGKININLTKLGIDMMSFSGHKIHAPKGIGILFKNKNTLIEKIMHGGSQEFNLRPGTENIPYIVGLSYAVEDAVKYLEKNSEKIKKTSDIFLKEILKIKKTKLNGNKKTKVPNINSISFYGVEGESILLRLAFEGVAVSTGSACSSQSLKASHVLSAIGLDPVTTHGTIRFSLSKLNTEKEAIEVAKKTKKIIEDLRAITSVK